MDFELLWLCVLFCDSRAAPVMHCNLAQRLMVFFSNGELCSRKERRRIRLNDASTAGGEIVAQCRARNGREGDSLNHKTRLLWVSSS